MDGEIEISYELAGTERCIPLVLISKLPSFPGHFDSTISFTPPNAFCGLWRASGDMGAYAYGKNMQHRGSIYSCADTIVIEPRLFE